MHQSFSGSSLSHETQYDEEEEKGRSRSLFIFYARIIFNTYVHISINDIKLYFIVFAANNTYKHLYIYDPVLPINLTFYCLKGLCA